jgi:2-phosphosulfolactate phosphatase
MPGFHSQDAFDVRCEWGGHGLSGIAPGCQLAIIIDVLSFSTAVDVAVSRSAEVYPHPSKDASAEARARDLGATLALGRGKGDFSLSPASMLHARPGQKIVLPSPNGAALSVHASTLAPHIVCACFRNLSAVARYAARFSPVAIIPAGERWPDDSLRPAIEDIACAGALVEQLPGSRSPEAIAALGIWQQMRANLLQNLLACASGRQLLEMGHRVDVEMAAQLDVSAGIPILRDGRYVGDAL